MEKTEKKENMKKTVTVVILGGTGDLARKKLVPALNKIAERDSIDIIDMIATGRRELDSESYKKFAGMKDEEISKCLRVHYQKVDFSKKGSMKNIKTILDDIEDKKGTVCLGRIFYFATSPEHFETIAEEISDCCHDNKKFNRIMIEKPFGYDLKSAKRLNVTLAKNFEENSIFRVDHYLGKETVQNILVLRLSNPFFERTWNSDFIDHIKIIVDEDSDVKDRIAYYDKSGAIRDMIQNHLLQIASFILMEPPKSISYSDLKKAKIDAIKNLYIKEPKKDIVLGKYESYKEELIEKDPNSSNTETFAEITFMSKKKRWKRVPIILRTGKNLKDKHAKIEVIFKKEPCNLYCNINTFPNKLVLNMQPFQDVDFFMNTMGTKSRKENKTTDDIDINHIKLNVSEEHKFSINAPESYEVLIEECIKGKKILFMSAEEIETAWKLIDDVREKITELPILPKAYKKGSLGPKCTP
jgi:glucose-6-phosphate 1-dehydrogenase